MNRWRAEITYRTKNGPDTRVNELAEIEDLQELIEQGPHFDTVVGINIQRINHVTDRYLTVEEAATQ